MNAGRLQAWAVKRLLSPGARELVFEGGLWVGTTGARGDAVFSTLLQWDGDAITRLDLDAADDAADLELVAARHMHEVELQLDALLRPLRRVEQAVLACVGLAWAGSIGAVQQALDWAEVAQAQAPDPFAFLEWSWILAATCTVVLVPLARRLWPRMRQRALRLALRGLAASAAI